MSKEQAKKIRAAIRRSHSESYILTFLVAFAATVIVTRVFLELAGYPQLGSSVLHVSWMPAWPRQTGRFRRILKVVYLQGER